MNEVKNLDVSSLEKALAQLKLSLVYYHSDIVQQDDGLVLQLRAAAIQAFEFTYELLLSEMDICKNYKKEKNMASHAYDEAKAEKVFKRIPEFIQEIEYFLVH